MRTHSGRSATVSQWGGCLGFTILASPGSKMLIAKEAASNRRLPVSARSVAAGRQGSSCVLPDVAA
eukprot:5040864-Amphidinium_carterae.1